MKEFEIDDITNLLLNHSAGLHPFHLSEHNRLIAVHNDPLGIYRGILEVGTNEDR